MANLAGTNVASAIKPFTDSDTFATHEAQYGKGGHRSVATLAERNAIHKDRRELGMIVHVLEDDNSYILNTNPTTDNTTGVNWGLYLVKYAEIAKALDGIAEISSNRFIYFSKNDPEIGADKAEFYPPIGNITNLLASVPVGTTLTKPIIVALEKNEDEESTWAEVIRIVIPIGKTVAATILADSAFVPSAPGTKLRINIIDIEENIENLTCRSNIRLTNY